MKAATGCADPLTGTWVARTYRTEFADWHKYVLTLARRGGALEASLKQKAWVAGPHDSAIPLCPHGNAAVEAHSVVATASFSPTGLRIDAQSSSLSALGSCVDEHGYSNDHFTGALDPATHILETRNTDDAHNANDRPYHFKRLSCQ